LIGERGPSEEEEDVNQGLFELTRTAERRKGKLQEEKKKGI